MKETNMEHYRGEIEELEFNIGRVDGKLIKCNGRYCEECEAFNELSCKEHITKWLMSEYKPESVLTAREKHFVEFAETGWITRTEDGILMWHQDKPRKGNIMWRCDANWFNICGFGHTFHFITWEDEEPWSVEELRKLKVESE